MGKLSTELSVGNYPRRLPMEKVIGKLSTDLLVENFMGIVPTDFSVGSVTYGFFSGKRYLRIFQWESSPMNNSVGKWLPMDLNLFLKKIIYIY